MGSGTPFQASLGSDVGARKPWTGKKDDFGWILGASWGPSQVLLGPFFVNFRCKSDMFEQLVFASPSREAPGPLWGPKIEEKT